MNLHSNTLIMMITVILFLWRSYSSEAKITTAKYFRGKSFNMLTVIKILKFFGHQLYLYINNLFLLEMYLDFTKLQFKSASITFSMRKLVKWSQNSSLELLYSVISMNRSISPLTKNICYSFLCLTMLKKQVIKSTRPILWFGNY